MENPTPLTESIEESLEKVMERAPAACNVTPFPEDKTTLQPFSDDEQVRRSMIWAGVSKKYAGCTFDNFKGNQNLIDVLKAMSTTNESIVLIGNTGCGKTHLAVSMLRESGNGYDAVFITVPELLLKIRSCFRDGATESEEEIIGRYAQAKVLILDDLGAEKSTAYSITTLYLIIDRRIQQERRTIITTNLTMEQIEDSLGARIASRLSEMKIIKIGMADYRKKRAAV